MSCPLFVYDHPAFHEIFPGEINVRVLPLDGPGIGANAVTGGGGVRMRTLGAGFISAVTFTDVVPE